MLKNKYINRPILWTVLTTFLVNTLVSEPVLANVPFLPAPGQMVALTPRFSPPLIRGLKIYKNNPFKFEFVLSQGDSTLKFDDDSLMKKVFLKHEAERLIKYFLASLTIPQKDMWVNLSPYEKEHIVPKEFGITEMGKELLAQDYLLKQVTASVMYPDGKVGRAFWRAIYQQAYEKLGSTDIPVNTFNKVWIVPEKAVVYENAAANTAVIIKSKLKVMLEEDYLSMHKHHALDQRSVSSDQNINLDAKHPTPDAHQLSNQLIRQVILPILEKEVNTGENFANLRQVYNSLVLALWYKNKLKESLMAKGYVNRRKINGIEVTDKNVDEEIFRQYLVSYKKGVYNYIKEEVTPSNETVARKYFSGGVSWQNAAMVIVKGPDSAQLAKKALAFGALLSIPVSLAGMYTASAAENPFLNTPAAAVQQYAENHSDLHAINAEGRAGSVYGLINSTLYKETGQDLNVWKKAIDVLARQGVLSIDGDIVTDVPNYHLRSLPNQAPHKIVLNLDLVRTAAAGGVRSEELPAPAAVLPAHGPAAAGGSAPPPEHVINAGIQGSLYTTFMGSAEIQAYNNTLAKSQRMTINRLIQEGRVTVTGPQGTRTITPDNTIVHPNETANFHMPAAAIGTAPATIPARVVPASVQPSAVPLPFLPTTTRTQMDENSFPSFPQSEMQRFEAMATPPMTMVPANLIENHFRSNVRPQLVSEPQRLLSVQAQENRDNIQRELFFKKGGPVAILANLNEKALFSPLVRFNDPKIFLDAIKNNLQIAIYVPKIRITDPLQWAHIKDPKLFQRLSVIEAEDFDFNMNPFVVWYQGEINGQVREGLMMTNETMAQTMLDVARNQRITRENVIGFRSILAELDGTQARTLAHKFYPNAELPKGNDLLLGVEVENAESAHQGPSYKPIRFISRTQWRNAEDPKEGVLRVVQINGQWHKLKYVPTTDSETMTFVFVDEPNNTHKIILGRNYLVQLRSEAFADRFLAEVENKQNQRYQVYLQNKQRFNRAVFLVNLGLSFVPNMKVPVGSILDFGWDIFNRPDLMTMPTETQFMDFVAQYVYHQSGSTANWDQMPDPEKDIFRQQARRMINGELGQEQMTQLQHYIEGKYGYDKIARQMGDALRVLNAATTTLKDSPLSRAARNIPFNPLSGAFNVNYAAAWALNHGPQDAVALRDIAGPNAPVVFRSLLPGIEINFYQLANKIEQETGSGNPLRAPFPHVDGPIISVNFWGLYDTKLRTQLEEITTINKANVRGSGISGYAFDNGWFSGKVHTYTKAEAHAQMMKGFVIGMTENNRPVFAIVERDAKGRESYRLFFPTINGVEENAEQVERDLKTYDKITSVMQQGGVEIYQAALGGDPFHQRTASGALQSMDYIHAGQSNRRGYMFDQSLGLTFAVYANDWNRIQPLEAFIRTIFNAQKTGFQGFAEYYDVYDFRRAQGDGAPGPGPNASILMSLLNLRNALYLKGDNTYTRNDDIINALAVWLGNNWKNENGTEPLALTVGAMGEYRHIMLPGLQQQQSGFNRLFNGSIGSQLDEQYRQMSEALDTRYDPQKGLYKAGGQQKPGINSYLSSDANTRTFLSKGMELFMQSNKMTIEDVMAWWLRVDAEFGINDYYIANGRRFEIRGLSLADADARAHGFGKAVMFEVTSEAVQVLNEIINYAYTHQHPEIVEKASKIRDGYLKTLRIVADANDGNLPQAAHSNIPTGFGYNTQEGTRATAPLLQKSLSEHQINIFRIGRPTLKPPSIIPLPAKVVTDEMTRVDIHIGDKEVDHYRRIIQAQNGRYIRPSGNTEATIESKADGTTVYLHLTRSLAYLQQREINAAIGRINAENMGHAIRGDPGFEGGAGIVSQVRKMPWGIVPGRIIPEPTTGANIRNSTWVRGVFDPQFEQWTDEQKANAQLQGYADLQMTTGPFTTIIYPLDTDVHKITPSPTTGKPVLKVYRNGLLKYSVDEEHIIVPAYDMKLHLEVGTYIYPNPYRSTHVQRLAGVTEYMAQANAVAELAKTPQGKAQAEAVTITLYANFERKAGDHHITKKVVYIGRTNNERRLQIFTDHEYPDSEVTLNEITEYQRNAYGLPPHSEVFFNGDDMTGPLDVEQIAQRLLRPVPGALRTSNTSPIMGQDRNLQRSGFTLPVESLNLSTNITHSLVINASGVVQSNRDADQIGGNTVTQNTQLDYDRSKFSGVVPLASETKSGSGTTLASDRLFNYDQTTGRSWIYHLDEHGQGSFRLFDPRWTQPILVAGKDSLDRWVVTRTDMDRDETHQSSTTTIGQQKGGVTTTSTYDRNHMRWELNVTKWAEQVGQGLALASSTVYQSPFGRTLDVLTASDDGINQRYLPRHDRDGIETGATMDLFNPATHQWVHQFDFSHYRFARGQRIRDVMDLGHQKPSTQMDDMATGLLLAESAPQGVYKSPLGISFEGLVTSRYAYNGPLALVPQTVVNNRGETRRFSGLNSSLLTWQIQGADHKIFYEDTDPKHRGRVSATRAFFDSSSQNVPMAQALWEHRTQNIFRQPTADNIFDLDLIPDSENTNYQNGKPVNRIPVLGSYDVSRLQGTFKIKLDEALSNGSTTVVNQEVIADNQQVAKTIQLAYRYGLERIQWKIIGHKKVVFNWRNEPGSYSVAHGIADTVDVFEINDQGEQVRPLYSAAAKDYNPNDGTLTMLITHYFGNNQDKTWTEMITMSTKGDIQSSIANLVNQQGEQDRKFAYYIYAPEHETYLGLTSENDRRIDLLAGAPPQDASKQDYWYFFADSKDGQMYDDIEVLVTDALGHQVTFTSKMDKSNYFENLLASGQIHELPFIYPYNFTVISTPDQKSPTRESSAVVNVRSLKGRNPFVMPVQWMADAGIDPSKINSVVVHYKGNKDVPVGVSALKTTQQQNEIQITKRQDETVLLGELKRYIADARIQFNSNDTVTADLGWNFGEAVANLQNMKARQGVWAKTREFLQQMKSTHEERDRVQFEILGDGQALMSRYDRDEKLGQWTPLTTIYTFDDLNEKNQPTANVYSGYPGFTVAEEISIVENGYSRMYLLSNGVGIPSIQLFPFAHAGNRPSQTTWQGDAPIIVPNNYGGGAAKAFRELTFNDLYMTFARSYFPKFNPNADHEAIDNVVLDRMRNNRETKPHPVGAFVYNTPFWKLHDLPDHPIPATADLIQIAKAWRNSHTGLIPLTHGTQEQSLDVAKQGDLLAALILSGDQEGIQIAQDILLYQTDKRPFSFWDSTGEGKVPVVNFLNINSGAPQRTTPDLNNPTYSTPKADSQAAITNAVYQLWKANGNPYARTMAMAMARTLVETFYSSDDEIGAFAEEKFVPQVKTLGLNFLGRPNNYLTRTNSKIFLLLNAMRQDTTLDADFRQFLGPRIESLQKFFDTYVMGRVKDESIVPYGFYRRQNGAIEFGEIPGSSSDTWFYFIEAAKAMGRIDDAKGIQLLDMMDRPFEVKTDGQVGLDIAIGPRQRVIAVDSTVNGLRTARLLGYQQAEDGFRRALAAYPRTPENMFPELIGINASAVDPRQGLDSGDMRRFYPRTDGPSPSWAPSLTAGADWLMAQQGGASVYNPAPKDRAQLSFAAPAAHSLFWVAMAYLPLASILLAPFINLLTGAVTKNLLQVRKFYLIGKVKASIPDFDMKDISAAYDLIAQTIEMTDQYGNPIPNPHQDRVHVLRKDIQGPRSLDILSANGFTALIALLKNIQAKDPTVINDDQIKAIINKWSQIFYEEFEKQATYWKTRGSILKSLRRIIGIRFRNNEEDTYTNPRYHPMTLINLYMWDEVKRIRQAEADKQGVKEQVGRSLEILNNEGQFRTWAQTKAKEARHPLLIGAARNLFLVYWIFIAAAFGRAEITHIQSMIHDHLYNNVLFSYIHQFAGSSTWGLLAAGIGLIMMVYMVPETKNPVLSPIAKWTRGLLALGGLGLGASWLMGFIGDYQINFLLPESLSISTGSQVIVHTLMQQVVQNTGLLCAGAAALTASWILDFIQGAKGYMRWLRRAFGGVGAGLIAYVLAAGLNVGGDASTALVMYSTILAFAVEGLSRLYTSHSIMATSIRYYYAPQYYFEGVRAFTMNFLVKAIYFVTSIVTILSIFPMIELKLSVGDPVSWMQLTGGYIQLIMTLILSHYSILIMVFTAIAATSTTLIKYIENHIGKFFISKKSTDKEIPPTVIKAIVYENTLPPNPEALTELWSTLIKSYPDAAKNLFDYIHIRLGGNNGPIRHVEDLKNTVIINQLLTDLADYEQTAICPTTGMPLILAVRQDDIRSNNAIEQNKLRAAFYIREYISLRTGSNGTTQELFIFLASLAAQWGERGKNVQLLIISNNIKSHFEADGRPSREYQLKHRLVYLWDSLTHRSQAPVVSQVVLNDTPLTSKIGSETYSIKDIDPKVNAEITLDRQVVSHYADIIASVLGQFARNSNKKGSEYLVGTAAVRGVTASSRLQGAAVSIAEATETSFGHFVVGTEAKTKGGWGAYGWAGAQAYDYNHSIIEFMKQGLRREPVSPYQMDLISEDIARAFAIAVNAMNRMLKPVFASAEIFAKKMRERTIGQLWGSWIRWDTGWVQLCWNLTMQQHFLLGNVPLSNKEYRVGLAGLFSLAFLAYIYVFTVPLGILYGVTFFVGISMVFYLWGTGQQMITIVGSLLMRIRNQGILSGLGQWLRDRPRDVQSVGGTQFFIHAFGALRAFTLGVSPVFTLMPNASPREESHRPLWGFVFNKERGKWVRAPNVKFDQTYLVNLVSGALGVIAYLFSLSHLDLLNVVLVYFLYLLMNSGLMSSFLYHEKIGEHVHPITEMTTKIIAHTLTALSVGGIIVGMNYDGQWAWAVLGSVLFFLISTATVLVHGTPKMARSTSVTANKARRILSEMSRTAWLSFFLQLPLVVVKIAGVLYMEIGTRTAVVSLPDLTDISLKILGAAGLIIGVGIINDLIKRRSANNDQLPRLIREYNRARPGLSLSKQEAVEDKLKEFRHDIGDKYWLKAKATKREIRRLLASDRAMNTTPSNRLKHSGGIDLAQTQVEVQGNGALIQSTFDDPAMLRLLLNSDGLTPIINDIKVMTPAMVDRFVGAN